MDPDPSVIGNPYIELYADALTAAGCEVVGISRRTRWSSVDVLNVHFPDLATGSRSLVRSIVWVCRLHGRVEAARRAGASVVWTAHNLRSHDQHHPRLEGWAMRRFSRRVDGFTVLSAAQAPVFEAAYPPLRGLPRAVTLHGHFRERYGPVPPQDEARARLGLPSDVGVLLAVGDLRSYKETATLVDTFRRTDDPRLRLLIAGRPRDAEVVYAVREASADDPRIILHMDWLSDAGVADHVSASDVVCIPYGTVLNSGVAMLALSMGRRVLMPNVPSALALREEAGEEWVVVAAGSELAPRDLTASFRTLPPKHAAPDLSAREWPDIGHAASEFFCQLRGKP